MAKPLLITLTCLLSYITTSSHAQTCQDYNFTSTGNNSVSTVYQSCNDLPVLDSFLHWTYDPSSATVQIAYRHAGITSHAGRWVAWAINPTSSGMKGSQALVAYQSSNGSMVAYQAPITSYDTQLLPGTLSFNVSGLSATYANGEITIFATLEVPDNKTSLHQVWQDGPLVDEAPQAHATSGDHVRSTGRLELLSGSPTGDDGGSSQENIHGVLNAVSWGIMMPSGAMIARYIRVFPSADPAWFYLHVACQISAYAVGVAGWATGLKLGPATSSSHGKIGITLFTLATLQMFALLIRPKKHHKLRIYWNVYHHGVGYSIVVLAVVNIFLGLNLLEPEPKWRHAYIGILVALIFIAIVLESFTWYIVIKRKRSAAGMNEKQEGLNGGYDA